MKKLIIAPYFWFNKFNDEYFIINLGSKQTLLKNKYFKIVEDFIYFFKDAKDNNEIMKFISQSDSHNYVYNFFINNNCFINNEWNEKNICSREELFINYLFGDYKFNFSLFNQKNVLIIGAGGIGNFMSFYLNFLNLNKIFIIDGDKIEKSNLNRQFLFSETDINKFKTETIKNKLKSNKIEIINEMFSYKLFITKFKLINLDLIILCADEIEASQDAIRFAANLNVPIINIGYLNDISVIGPTIIDFKTDSCQFCNNISSDNLKFKKIKLKAPSSFINNSISSGIGLVEVLKILTGNISSLNTINKRIGIKNFSFEKIESIISKNINCWYCKI